MVIRSLLQEAGLPRLDAEVLLCHVLGIRREKLLFLYETPVPKEHAEAFLKLAAKCRAGCPVAYLTGEKEFYSLPFFVSPETLIPRPDTELLAEWGLSHCAGKRVLDLCCGSGCIGVTIGAKGTPASLCLADISEAALVVAEKNAKRHKVRASLLTIDILKEELPGEYDLILCNPPYIEDAVIRTLSPSVRDFEPFSALSGGEDGLAFYPAIIEKAFSVLSLGGRLGLEIGYRQGEAVQRMMRPFFSDVTLAMDLGGNPRMVTGIKREAAANEKI